jgi:hypothetical protein
MLLTLCQNLKVVFTRQAKKMLGQGEGFYFFVVFVK